MAKRYGSSRAATTSPEGPECVWPLCDVTAGLITWVRCFDFEPLEHCGLHHAIVGMLHRNLHPDEEE